MSIPSWSPWSLERHWWQGPTQLHSCCVNNLIYYSPSQGNHQLIKMKGMTFFVLHRGFHFFSVILVVTSKQPRLSPLLHCCVTLLNVQYAVRGMVFRLHIDSCGGAIDVYRSYFIFISGVLRINTMYAVLFTIGIETVSVSALKSKTHNWWGFQNPHFYLSILINQFDAFVATDSFRNNRFDTACILFYLLLTQKKTYYQRTS